MDNRDLQGWLARRYYAWRPYLPARLLYHPDHFRLRALIKGDAAAVDALARRRLRRILVHALRHVPYYRRTVRLSAAEAAHEPLGDVLAAFPYLAKDEVMAHQRDFLDRRLDPRRLLYATSGGSSGQGIGMWRSKRLADIEKAFFAHEWGRYSPPASAPSCSTPNGAAGAACSPSRCGRNTISPWRRTASASWWSARCAHNDKTVQRRSHPAFFYCSAYGLIVD